MDIGIPIKGHLKVMLHATVLAQHSVARLEQRCNHWKHCHNNVLTLCCAKNCHCESSGVTSPLKYYIKSNIRLKRSKINYNASVLDNTAKRTETADAKCIALPVTLLGHLFCVHPPHRP